jgi:hypothetical protein
VSWNSVEFIIYHVLHATMHYYINLSVRIIKRIMIRRCLYIYVCFCNVFFSLILPKPGVQIAYSKYMSKYNG